MFALHITGKEIASSWLQLYVRIGYVLELANCCDKPPQISMAYNHTKGLILAHLIPPSSWQGLRDPGFFHIVAALSPEPWSPPLDPLPLSHPSAEGERMMKEGGGPLGRWRPGGLHDFYLHCFTEN